MSILRLLKADTRGDLPAGSHPSDHTAFRNYSTNYRNGSESGSQNATPSNPQSTPDTAAKKSPVRTGKSRPRAKALDFESSQQEKSSKKRSFKFQKRESEHPKAGSYAENPRTKGERPALGSQFVYKRPSDKFSLASAKAKQLYSSKLTKPQKSGMDSRPGTTQTSTRTITVRRPVPGDPHEKSRPAVAIPYDARQFVSPKNPHTNFRAPVRTPAFPDDQPLATFYPLNGTVISSIQMEQQEETKMFNCSFFDSEGNLIDPYQCGQDTPRSPEDPPPASPLPGLPEGQLQTPNFAKKAILPRFSHDNILENSAKKIGFSPVYKIKLPSLERISRAAPENAEAVTDGHRFPKHMSEHFGSHERPTPRAPDPGQEAPGTTAAKRSSGILHMLMDNTLPNNSSDEDDRGRGTCRSSGGERGATLPSPEDGERRDSGKTDRYLLNLEIEFPDEKRVMLNIRSLQEIEARVDDLIAQHDLNEDAKYYIMYLVGNELNSNTKNEYGYSAPFEEDKG